MNAVMLMILVLSAQPSEAAPSAPPVAVGEVPETMPATTCLREGMSDHQEFNLYDEKDGWYAYGVTKTKWVTVELRQSYKRAKVDYWAFVGTCHHQREYSECGGEYEPADNTVITCYPAHGEPFTVEYQCDATDKLVELYRKWKNDNK